MCEEKENLGQVNILVKLSTSLKRFTGEKSYNGKDLQNHLQRYLSDLLFDLELPMEIKLTIDVDGSESKSEMESYQVLIENKKCRIALPTEVPDDIKTIELARLMARDIYKNRELFITIPLSGKLRKKWLPDDSAISVEEFHKLLLLYVGYGFSLKRKDGFLKLLKEGGQSRRNAETIFEESFSRHYVVSVKVFLDKTQYSGIHSPNINASTRMAPDHKPVSEVFEKTRKDIFDELGLILPGITIAGDEGLEEKEFRFQLNDIRLPPMTGLESQAITSDTSDGLLRNISRRLSGEIRSNAASFLTSETVMFSLVQLRKEFPVLIEMTLKRFDTVLLTRIFRDLLDEEISIKDIRTILESLMGINDTSGVDQNKYMVFFPDAGNICPVKEKKPVEDLEIGDYSNFLRMSLKRYIGYKYLGDNKKLFFYLLDPRIEERIKDTDQHPLEDEEHRRLIKAVFEQVKQLPGLQAQVDTPVILTTSSIRKRLRKLIEKEFPWLPVLSRQELLPKLVIQPIAKIFFS